MNSSASKTEAMFELVETYQAGSEIKSSFCARHGIKVSTFSYWITRYNRHHKTEEPCSSFVRYSSTETFSHSLGQQIHFPNGVRISGDLNTLSSSFSDLVVRLGQIPA